MSDQSDIFHPYSISTAINYRSRDEQIRAEISKDEAVRRIEQIYHAQYDPDCGLDGCFDAWDQLLACESVNESTPVRDNYNQIKEENNANENSRVNGGVNDSYKRSINFQLTESKLKVITQLEACTYRTSPIKVSALLEEFFGEWPFQEWTGEQNYWLSVAQKRTPRPIVRVIKLIVKQHNTGITTVKNPAKLFSFLIKKRAERKRRL